MEKRDRQGERHKHAKQTYRISKIDMKARVMKTQSPSKFHFVKEKQTALFSP